MLDNCDQFFRISSRNVHDADVLFILHSMITIIHHKTAIAEVTTAVTKEDLSKNTDWIVEYLER